LGLKTNRSIVAWGRSYEGQCRVPAPNTAFIDVAAGGNHSLGLKLGGAIVAWGDNTYGQCEVPVTEGGFLAIAAGAQHSLGLYFDGRIFAWGNDESGQTDVPEPNEDFVAVAAGAEHSMGLKSDGTLVAWGANTATQCIVPDPNERYIAMAGGWRFSLGLKSLSSPPVAAPAVQGIPSASRITIFEVAPNPFNPLTEIRFESRDAGALTLEIYDTRGAHVNSIPLGTLLPGEHRARWDGRDRNGRNVSSGVYFLQLRSAAQQSRPAKAVLVR
jgi:hypothetical protein